MSRFARLPGTGSACIIRGTSGTCLRLSDFSCRRRRIVTVTVTLMSSILVPGPGPGELSSESARPLAILSMPADPFHWTTTLPVESTLSLPARERPSLPPTPASSSAFGSASLAPS